MRPEIVELQTDYARLYRRMTGAAGSPALLTTAQHDGTPHIEFVDGKYRYVSTERGLELSRQAAPGKTEMLFWMLSDIAFWMGVKYELENRVPKQDARRLIFAEWQRIMEKLGSPYSEMNAKKIEGILTENPLDDSL